MITIPLQLSDELAQEVLPLQNRLPEIVELGLRQLQSTTNRRSEKDMKAKEQVWTALESTGIVMLPRPNNPRPPRARRTPIYAGGLPASEMIIAERHRDDEPT
jgi:hypothetical protein